MITLKIELVDGGMSYKSTLMAQKIVEKAVRK